MTRQETMDGVEDAETHTRVDLRELITTVLWMAALLLTACLIASK